MVGGCVCVCAQTCISKGAACFSSWHCSQLLGFFNLYKNGNDGVFQLLQHHKSQGTSLYKQHCCHSVAWQITTFTCRPAGEPVPSGTPRLQEHHHRAGSCSSTWSFSHQTPPHSKEGQWGPWAMPWKGRKSYFLCASYVQHYVFEWPVQLGWARKGYRGQMRSLFVGRVIVIQRTTSATSPVTMNVLTTPWDLLPAQSCLVVLKQLSWKKVGN